MTSWITKSTGACICALLVFAASTAVAQPQVLYENFFDNADGLSVSASDARNKTFVGLNTDSDAMRLGRTRPAIFDNAEPPYLQLVPWTGRVSASFDVNITNKKDISLELRMAASRKGHQFGPLDFQNYFREGESLKIYVNGQLLPEGLYVGGNPHALQKWFRRFSALTNPSDANNSISTQFETFSYAVPASFVPAGSTNLTVKIEMEAGRKKIAAVDYLAVKGEPATCADTDGDGVDDCSGDVCPNDPSKTTDAGVCGCGNPETDSDGDGAPDCIDLCPTDPGKIDPGTCGCNTSDADSDGDGTFDCEDGCPSDANKIEAGICGCGEVDADSDGDGAYDCHDDCPLDANKEVEGVCGCNVADTDSDGDGTADCNDQCPNDSNKDVPGVCGCGEVDADSDGDGTYDCNDNCADDIDKVEPGVCGCGTADTDSDGDGLANCLDGCIADPNKTTAGQCGCGVADTDSDNDGTADCNDGCSTDSNKTAPGACGCGTPDTDSDGDGTPDCNDQCVNDAGKTAPGQCGCGNADTDTDGDGTADCNDQCVNDADKTEPGTCGCGVADTDTDGDGTPDCNDNCVNDAAKTAPGQCGCGVVDTDSDNDGTADCNDQCANDAGKTAPGQCGCGVADTDSDDDGTADCNDGCSTDSNKTAPGTCGCGTPDTDSDGDGTADCNDGCDADANKTAPGVCGCGVADTDADGDGEADCNDSCPADALKTEPLLCGCGNAETDSNGDGEIDCLDNGGFDEALTGWTTDDNGSGTVEGTTFASENWARLVTGSPVMIGQEFITPGAAFLVKFEYLFFTTTGDIEVKLGGQTIGSIGAPSTLTGTPETFSVRINSAHLPTLLGQMAMLEIVLDGPTGSEALVNDVRFEREDQLVECFLGADTIGAVPGNPGNVPGGATNGNNGILAEAPPVGSNVASMPGFEFVRGSTVPDGNLGHLKELRVIIDYGSPDFPGDFTDYRANEWQIYLFKRDAFFNQPEPLMSHPDFRRFLVTPSTPAVCSGGAGCTDDLTITCGECIPDAIFGAGSDPSNPHYDVRFDLSLDNDFAAGPVMTSGDWVIGVTARDTALGSGSFNHNDPNVIVSWRPGPLPVEWSALPPFGGQDAGSVYNGYLLPPLGLAVDAGTIAITVTEMVPPAYAVGRDCR